ncbi:MAG: c-type cytochrome, partial [Acidobacteriota bacterium]
NGLVVQRGFKAPPSLHDDRLRVAPVGHFFDVITNGFGAMPSYATQIPVTDRWAIIAYIRALQLSEHATIDAVPPDQRSKLGVP